MSLCNSPWPLWRMKSQRFQFMSDLHLEVGRQYSTFDIPCRAPYLILAGDVGRLCDYQMYLDFLTKQCLRFLKVFLVLGNHEFYGGSRAEGLRFAADLEQEAALQGRLIVLNRRRVDVSDNVIVLGCTLHSRISDVHRAVVESKVKDFTRIQNWTVSDHNTEHSADVEWLQNQIRDIKKGERVDSKGTTRSREIVVVTHHAPIRRGSSQPRDENNPWSDAFSTQLVGINGNEPLSSVRWWIFGHTHYTTSCSRDGVNFISNQRGYVLSRSDEKRTLRAMIGSLFKHPVQRSDHKFSVDTSIKV